MQLIPPKAPRLPTPSADYDRAYFDQFNNSLRLYFNQIDTSFQQLLLGFNTYGAFYDTTTQTNPVANVARPVTFNSVGEAFGIEIGTPSSRIVVGRSGVYNFQFSAQMDHAGGGTATVYFWFRKNGQDIPNSATKMVVPNSANELAAAWNYVLSMEQGDYFELVWSSPDTGASLPAIPAAAPVPAIPSVIITATYMCPGDVGAT